MVQIVKRRNKSPNPNRTIELFKNLLMLLTFSFLSLQYFVKILTLIVNLSIKIFKRFFHIKFKPDKVAILILIKIKISIL